MCSRGVLYLSWTNAVFQPCNDIIRFKPLKINMEYDGGGSEIVFFSIQMGDL